MAAKFQLKRAKNDKFHFNLVATNGQVILSSEMYETRAKAGAGIGSVKKNAVREGGVERLTSDKGQPYFVVKSTNTQVVGKSQMYASASTCSRAGEGYWRYFPAAGALSFSGAILDSVAQVVADAPRWVMLGSVSHTVPASSVRSDPASALLPQSLYGFDGSGYSHPAEIEPGRGYWIYVLQPCTLHVGP